MYLINCIIGYLVLINTTWGFESLLYIRVCSVTVINGYSFVFVFFKLSDIFWYIVVFNCKYKLNVLNEYMYICDFGWKSPLIDA